MNEFEDVLKKDLIAMIEQLKEENKRLKEKAFIDPLTQLNNRQSYNENLDIQLSSAQRYGHALSIIIMDLDHFKLVNDTYGHGMGDDVLKNTADIIKDNIRKSDIACRFGGEEMVIILPYTTKSQAAVVAEHIRVALDSIVYQYKGEKFPVTASFGISGFEDKMKESDLFERADKALYAAKHQGRNRVCIASHSQTSLKV